MTPDELLVFNGIDGSTGVYLQDPLPPQQLADLILGRAPGAAPAASVTDSSFAPDTAHLNDLSALDFRENNPDFAPGWNVDPMDLASAGWGVVFAHDSDPRVREALRELLEHRKAQAGRTKERFYREFTGGQGHRPGETKQAFLARHGVTNGMPADPEFLPYYLLIVGDPERVPFRFQYQLDVEYAVGRLWFAHPDGTPDLEAFACYARSVVEAESTGLTLPRRATFFGVRNEDDGATRLSEAELVRPLPQGLQEKLHEDHGRWDFVVRAGPQQADKASLARLLGGAETPALLFTASHGVGFPAGDIRQFPHQGALLCQDWPGPVQWQGRLPEDFYFSADDVGADARLLGLLAFHFACYGAGTPRADDFAHLTRGAPGQRAGIAPRAFVARLPQRLLGHPSGGALAVVGHVERAWTTSFLGEGRIGRQLQAFEDTLGRLLQGYPVGFAMESFNIRYAALSEALAYEINESKFGTQAGALQLSAMWTAANDARNYTVLGDPAVRLMVDGAEPIRERPVIKAVDVPPGTVPSAPVAGPAREARAEAPPAPRGDGLRPVTFEPPPEFRDVSEYRFAAAGERRLAVLPTGVTIPSADLLLAAARAYAQQLGDLFDVEDAAVSQLQMREDGAAFVTVTALLPGPAAQGGRAADVVEHSAFLRFPSGLVVRVTLTAPVADPAAQADFLRLVETVRPAEAVPAQFAIPSGDRGEAGAAVRPVGPFVVELPPGARELTSQLTFRDPAGAREFTVDFAPEPAAPAAAAFAVGEESLFGPTRTDLDDTGQGFAYEIVPDPWASRVPSAPAAAPFALQALPGPAEARTASAERTVGTSRVVVRVRSAEPAPDLQRLAQEVADTLRRPE